MQGLDNVTRHAAPLPFIGQKRFFVKAFRAVLDKNIPAGGAGWTIVDAFGGSGLLAHTAKRAKPDARVVYNDFDGYVARIRHIADTNRLRRRLSAALAHTPKGKKLNPETRAACGRLILSFDGFTDVNCAASWLLFSGSQAGSLDALFAQSWYNNLRQNDYSEADGYLDGLEITRSGYRELLPQFLSRPNTLLVLDPPYVSTQQGAYAVEHYFGMVDFLRLMGMVRPPFVFFSSTRSEFPAYLDMLKEDKMPAAEKFAGCKTVSLCAKINSTARYEDNMVYRF